MRVPVQARRELAQEVRVAGAVQRVQVRALRALERERERVEVQDAARVRAGQGRGRALGPARARGVGRDVPRESTVLAARSQPRATVAGRLAMSWMWAVTIDASWPECSRSTQTRRRPSSWAGTMSWYQLTAAWTQFARAHAGARLEGLEVAERGLVAARLLGGHDEVDRDAERGAGGLEQVVVAVREDAELPARPRAAPRAPPTVSGNALDRVPPRPPAGPGSAIELERAARRARGALAQDRPCTTRSAGRAGPRAPPRGTRARGPRSARRRPARGCAGTRICQSSSVP